jgi:hypothetical protein
MIFFGAAYSFPFTTDLVSSGDWGCDKGFGWRLMRLLINNISRI